MTKTYLFTSEGIAAAQRFGDFLRLWFEANDWTQELPSIWAAANNETGPHASQMSKLINGKAEPKPHLFRQLYKFNLAVADSRPGPMPTDKAFLLEFGKALHRPDGTPLSAGDFLELYLNIQRPSFVQLCSKHYENVG